MTRKGRGERPGAGGGGAPPSPRGRAKGAAPVSEALRETLALLNLPAVDALVRIHRGWQAVAGPAVAAKALPDRLRGGVLTLRVENHAWAQELTLHRPVLLAKLASLLGEGTVKDLRFETAPLPPAKADGAPRAVRPPRAPSPPLPEPEGLSALEDGEMRALLLSIQRKAAAFAATLPGTPPDPGPPAAVEPPEDR